MADRIISLGIPELMGVAAMKETLQAQQELLQQLYNELDVEREAAATATSEALSMMLRLQGEKAAVEMEASQYKRIAEEKLFHAEEAITIFRELIYQKEMQIASLEFQVQAYRFKLLSMGCSDLGVSETQYPEIMLTRNGMMGGKGSQRHLRRGTSLPPVFSENGEPSIEREKFPESSEEEALEEIKELDPSADRKPEIYTTGGGFPTHWEQIRKLDERVKELTAYTCYGENDKQASTNGIQGYYSSNPKTSKSTPRDSREESPANHDVVGHANLLESEADRNSPSSIKVQDIFEVPQTSDHNHGAALQRKEKWKLNTDVDCRLGKPHPVETFNSNNSDRSSWDMKRSSLSPYGDNRSYKPREALTMEHQLCYKRPAVAEYELQQLNRRLKCLEDERITARQEITAESGGEGLKLLREIKERLNKIQAEVVSLKRKSSSHRHHPKLASLSEAMLHFWL